METVAELIAKVDAKAQGLLHYFTGIACIRGHVSKRYVSDGSCFACLAFKRDTPERKAYQDLYRQRSEVKDRRSKRWRQFAYEMGDDEFNCKLVAQNYCCEICKIPFDLTRQNKATTPHVDHNHTTDANRGLLCKLCNALVGNCKEQVSILQSAETYIRRYNS